MVAPTLLVLHRDDAVRASGDHPLIAHVSAYPTAELPAWRYGDAVAIGYHYWDHPGITAVGPADDLASLLGAIGDTVRSWASVPSSAVAALGPGFLLDTHDWAFRWTTRPTGTPEDAARWLRPEDDDEVRALLSAAFPHASMVPGSPKARRWAGIRDGDGRLVACAADATGRAGTGFVASITTLPELRGHGLGRRVTGWLLDRLREEHGRSALWVDGGNGPASAVYDRLGMHLLPMTSGALPAAHGLVRDHTAQEAPAD